MYSVIVGCSPHTGQSGSRRIVTSLNSAASASKSSSRPTSGSPIPSASLSASFACSEPMIPGSTPSTPPSAHEGASSGGEDAVDVLGRQPLLVRDHLHVGVQRLDRPLRGLHLRLAEHLRRVDDLALQVRLVDDVG